MSRVCPFLYRKNIRFYYKLQLPFYFSRTRDQNHFTVQRYSLNFFSFRSRGTSLLSFESVSFASVTEDDPLDSKFIEDFSLVRKFIGPSSWKFPPSSTCSSSLHSSKELLSEESSLKMSLAFPISASSSFSFRSS